MKISVIIPTYNSENCISKCLQSIVSQTYADIEIVVIDGKSTDKTVAIVESFATEYHYIKWVSAKDGGIYDAMNKGIKLGSGDYMYFIGSDDYLYSNTVFEQISKLMQGNAFSLIYGNVLMGKSGKIHAGKFQKMRLFRKNICHQGIFYHQDLFAQFGCFDTNYKLFADLDFNFKVFFSSHTIVYTEIIVAYFSQEGISSATALEAYKHELQAVYRGMYKKFTYINWLEYALYFLTSRAKKYIFNHRAMPIGDT